MPELSDAELVAEFDFHTKERTSVHDTLSFLLDNRTRLHALLEDALKYRDLRDSSEARQRLLKHCTCEMEGGWINGNALCPLHQHLVDGIVQDSEKRQEDLRWSRDALMTVSQVLEARVKKLEEVLLSARSIINQQFEGWEGPMLDGIREEIVKALAPEVKAMSDNLFEKAKLGDAEVDAARDKSLSTFTELHVIADAATRKAFEVIAAQVDNMFRSRPQSDGDFAWNAAVSDLHDLLTVPDADSLPHQEEER